MSWNHQSSALFNPLLCRGASFKKRAFELLQKAIFDRAKDLDLIGEKPEGIIDSSGFEARHVSRHYHYKIKRHFNRDQYKGWPKVSIVAHRQSHLVAAA